MELLTGPREAGAVNNNGMAVMSIRGSLDVITPEGATGWAYSPSGEKVTVQALLNHEIIGEAVANLHREDLAAVGFSDGNCGYDVRFYSQLDPRYLPFVVVKPDGGDVELPRASPSGFGDFFRALYREYPLSGRYRSVFGGLWTDRLDAAAILKGRTEIGMVDQESASTLSEFIENGIVVLQDLPGVPSHLAARRNGARQVVNTAPSRDTVIDRISNVLASESVGKTLRHILEDHPLAIKVGMASSDPVFRQPSTMEVLPPPGECVALISPGDAEIAIEVVRGSHRFPEFTPDGISRWLRPCDNVTEISNHPHAMLDRLQIAPGSAAIMGPGTLYRVVGQGASVSIHALCTPGRQAPLHLAPMDQNDELRLNSGARVWIRQE